MRYRNLNTKRLDTGRTVYQSKIFSPIKKREDDIYIITQETDRLDLLANQFYGDSRLWWIIAHANNLNSAELGLEEGIQLRIPADQFIAIEDSTE